MKRTILAACLWLSACGTGQQSLSSATQEQSFKGATVELSSTDSAALAGTRLDVPAAALSSATTVTVKLGEVPIVRGAIGPVVEVSPADLSLQVSATLRIPMRVPRGAVASDVIVVARDSSGALVELVPTSLAHDFATVQLMHFGSFQAAVRRHGHHGGCSTTGSGGGGPGPTGCVCPPAPTGGGWTDPGPGTGGGWIEPGSGGGGAGPGPGGTGGGWVDPGPGTGGGWVDPGPGTGGGWVDPGPGTGGGWVDPGPGTGGGWVDPGPGTGGGWVDPGPECVCPPEYPYPPGTGGGWSGPGPDPSTGGGAP